MTTSKDAVVIPSEPGVRGFKKYKHETQAQSYAELLDRDSRSVPEFIRDFVTEDVDPVGPCEIPIRWYTDPEVHDLEIEQIWKRTWQIACRVDHVPHVGDTFLYEVAGLSVAIVRVADDEIKGYWNACLHRGAPIIRHRLCRVDRLQCPFHGFTWDLEGNCQMIPHPEEFPHIDPDKFALPEVQVATWQGFVFINPDLEAESLESYMGEFDNHFTRLPFTRRELSAHIGKVFPANWKAVQEAFMESFHVLTTHPQYAESSGADRCTDFGVSGNFSRGVVPFGVTNDYVAETPDEQYIWHRINDVWDDDVPPEELVLAPGATARQAMAERARAAFGPLLGSISDEASDAELIDIFYYTLFPNFHTQGFFTGVIYRFLPYGDAHDKCIMDIMFLSPVPEGAEPKPPAEMILLGEDEDWTSIESLGAFGAFVSQDSGNLYGVMQGMRSNQRGFINLARKYEMKLRHFYSVYEEATGLSSAEEVAALKR